MEYRIESDFLGEKQVPKDAYYGVQTMRALENFPITGQTVDPVFIRAIAKVKKAAALAHKKTGGLAPEIADLLVKACDEVIGGALADQFPVDPIQGGAGTSINMNINEVITNKALEFAGKSKGSYDYISPNDHANLGQSTNDAFPTAIHIASLDRIEALTLEMEKLAKAFENKAYEFRDVLKMGRTHLQDAVPILLGQEFTAYALVLKRDLERINNTKRNLYAVNMGATAVGTGLNADPAYIREVVRMLADISGHKVFGVESLVDGTQNTDCYMELSSALKICMLNMSKIANDIRMMASGPRCGFYELKLPPRQPGSSIMPGKVNPVMAEVLNQCAFQVTGNDLTISMASEAGQFELNVMEPVIVYNLLQSLSIMENVFRVFREHLLEGLEANIERARAYVDGSVGIMTALNPHIGYKNASRIAREAIHAGTPVRELILRDGILTKEELDIILNPANMTSPGISGEELLKKK